MAMPKLVHGRSRPSPAAINWSLNNPTVRALLYQVLVVVLVVAAAWYLIANTVHNLESRRITSGFGFLARESGFAIGESLIEFGPADTYFRALVVGVLNTIRVSVVGIVLATLVGVLIGLARLSKNWLLSKFASLYVEVLRNVPLLLQLFFWYAIISENLPGPRQALEPLPGTFLSNRGIRFPIPAPDPVHVFTLLAAVAGAIASYFVYRWARQRQAATGEQFPVLWASLGLIIGLPVAVWLIGGAPMAWELPKMQGFNFQGGGTLSPEFAALLMGLVTYTAAFIAEIVRSGILAVSHGQTEAALALGLRRAKVMQLVILPQALRVIVPPTTSQYLNLTKNSSLAVAIGYPDLVSIANTAINQTGQAIEGIAIIMAVHLTISLSISGFMNWYNRHIALVER